MKIRIRIRPAGVMYFGGYFASVMMTQVAGPSFVLQTWGADERRALRDAVSEWRKRRQERRQERSA